MAEGIQTLTYTDAPENIDNSFDNRIIIALGGNDTIYNRGAKVLIDGGEGADSLGNNSNGVNTTILGGEGNDYIWNNAAALIEGGTGDDHLENRNGGSNATILGGESNDSILNSAAALIDGGEGNDTLNNTNLGSNATLLGGAGNDFIMSYNASNISIDAGTDNDTIILMGAVNSTTVTGGKGNDNIMGINLSGDVLYQYTAGDGNDFIDGFNSNSTLSIAGGIYSSAQNNSDIIITIGDGKITLGNAATLSSVNIIGVTKADKPTDNDDYLENTLSGVTINALGGNDTIDNKKNGTNVLMDGAAGNDELHNRSDNVTVVGGDGNDLIANHIGEGGGKNVSIDAGTGNDSIRNWSNKVTMLGGAGNDSIYNYKNSGGGSSVTIDGGADNDFVDNWGDNSSIAGGDGNDILHNHVSESVGGGENITMEGGSGNDDIRNWGSRVTLSGGTGEDTIFNNNGNNILIRYNMNDGNDSIIGFNETSTLSISGAPYTSAQSNSDIVITVGDGKITLSNAATLSSVNIIGVTKADKPTDGDDYLEDTLSGVTINALAGNDTIYNHTGGNYSALNGGDGHDSIRNYGSFVTIDAEAGNDVISSFASNVTMFGGADNDTLINNRNTYSNILIDGGSGNDSIRNFGINSTLRGGEGDDTIRNNAEGYVNDELIFADGGRNVTIEGGKGNDSIRNEGDNVLILYSAGDGSDAISGFNETSTLSIAGSEYTSAQIGNDLIVSVGDGKITLRGAATLSTVNIKGTLKEDPIWRLNGTTATFGTSTTALITVGGVKDTNGILLAGTTITISESALNQSNVTVSSGYELALANDVTRSTTTEGSWRLNGTVATFTTASTSAGYALENNRIIYSAARGGDIVTVSGVVSTGGLSINGNVVTVAASALNKSAVTISAGYTLALADDVAIADLNKEGTWTLNGTTATYKIISDNGGYALSNNQIVYTAAGDAIILAEISGVDKAGMPVTENNKITLSELSFADDENISVVKNDGGYEFEITEGNYQEVTFSGSDSKERVTNNGSFLRIELGKGGDSIVNSGDNVTIDVGEGNDRVNNAGMGVTVVGGKGNDNISLGGGNLFVYSAGDGKDVLFNFDKNDTIKIASNSTAEANVKGKDIVFKIGAGSITIRDGAKLNAPIKFVDADENALDISKNIYTSDGVINDDTITLASDFSAKIYTAEVEIVDGTQLEKGISIAGGAQGVSLTGGSGKDTLINGTTDGFELTGGKGNDVFVYRGGKGTITDYSQKGTLGKDKISLAGVAFSDYSIGGGNVILTAGENDSLTLVGAVGKEITFGTAQTTINVYKDEGIFNSTGKAITIAADKEDFVATKGYAKLVTIDGSRAERISITGNKKANYIVAGKDDSTLNGGKGRDTLVGGGNVVFVFENKSGNKLIKNFGDSDKLSLIGGASISEVKASGNDLELKVGSNKITLEGSRGQSFTFDDGEEKTYTAEGLLLNKAGDTVTLTSSASTKIDLSSAEFERTPYDKVRHVSGGELKRALEIVGDGEANLLIGGKGNDTLRGGESNDSLWGGKGNDELYGGGGEDSFIFNAGDGTDTIKNFEADIDKLVINDKHGNYGDVSKGVLSGDKLTLSIKGGGKLIVEGVAAGDKININGVARQIIGKNLIK